MVKKTSSLAGLLLGLSLLSSAPLLAQEIDAADAVVAPRGIRPQWLNLRPGPVPRHLVDIGTEDLFASIGRGFDPVTNTILDLQCVKPLPGTEGSVKGTAPFTNFDFVQNSKTHSEVSGSSFSAGVIIKAVQLGFGTSNTQGDYFNGVDTFVRLYVRAVTEGTEWRDVTWTDDALQLLKSDMSEFLKQCGTRYVRAVVSGHLLDLTLHFSLNQDKRTNADAFNLSLSVPKLFGVSAGSKDAESNLTQTATAFLWSQGRGVLALPPPPTPPTGGSPAATPPATPAASPAVTAAAAPTPAAPAPTNPDPGALTPPKPPNVETPVAPGGVAALYAWYESGFVAAVQAANLAKKEASPLYIRVDDYRSKFRLERRYVIPLLAERIADVVSATADSYTDLVTVVSTTDYALSEHPDNSAFFVEDKKAIGETNALAKQIFKDYGSALDYCSGVANTVPKNDAEALNIVSECDTRLATALAPMSKLKITRKIPPPAP